MKIAIVTPVHPPYKGGMGAVAANDARQLKARGFEVTVFTPDYDGRDKHEGVVYVSPLLTFGNAALLPSLLWKLKGFDLVHLHYTFYGADVLVWLLSLLTGKPYIITYHMQPKSDDWRDIIFRLHRFFIEPLIVRQAEAVLVSSRDYAQSIGLKHRNLIDMPFGVDEQRFTPGRDDEYRAKLGIPAGAQVFIFVGGLDKAHSFKGVGVLIRAAAYLPTDKDWRVLVVGDGDMRSAYVELARALGIADKVVFAGAVPDDELPRAYRAGDVHVLPSTSKSEAFGLVTLEAAASGLPSIVSNLPGVRTLVEKAVTGFVVEPEVEEELEDAMQKFLADPALAKMLGTQARERILTGYRLEMLADRLVGVYNKYTRVSV